VRSKLGVFHPVVRSLVCTEDSDDDDDSNNNPVDYYIPG